MAISEHGFSRPDLLNVHSLEHPKSNYPSLHRVATFNHSGTQEEVKRPSPRSPSASKICASAAYTLNPKP